MSGNRLGVKSRRSNTMRRGAYLVTRKAYIRHTALWQTGESACLAPVRCPIRIVRSSHLFPVGHWDEPKDRAER